MIMSLLYIYMCLGAHSPRGDRVIVFSDAALRPDTDGVIKLSLAFRLAPGLGLAGSGGWYSGFWGHYKGSVLCCCVFSFLVQLSSYSHQSSFWLVAVVLLWSSC